MNDSRFLNFESIESMNQWSIHKDRHLLYPWMNQLSERIVWRHSSKTHKTLAATYWRFTFSSLSLHFFPTFHICILKNIYILKHWAYNIIYAVIICIQYKCIRAIFQLHWTVCVNASECHSSYFCFFCSGKIDFVDTDFIWLVTALYYLITLRPGFTDRV